MSALTLSTSDPPFNSNRHYEAPIGSKAAEHGELADRNPAAYSVIEAARQAHGKGMQAYLVMMAVRLLEMLRILKPTGSIYLHCDPTASHYLKLLLDGIIGVLNFRSSIAWKRSSAHSDGKQGRKQHGRIQDNILYYTMGRKWTWNPQFVPYSDEYISRTYRHIEEGSSRRYTLGDITGPGGAAKGSPEYEIMSVTRFWRYSEAEMQRLIDAGRIVQARPGVVPRYKRYLDEMAGVPIQDIWIDIVPIQGQAKERTGYPTQKPLALLERIIKTSSNPGDLVLDPFCGCATALVAADRLQREWAGIDLSPLAIKLVDERIAEDRGLWGGATALTAPPKRTDLGDLPPPLPDAPSPALRRAGRRLWGLRDALPVPRHGRRPHAAPLQGRDGPSRQPATALLGLQPQQGRKDNGRMEGRAMTDNERDAELGRTLREYMEHREQIGCLRSKLGRTAEAIADVLKVMDEKKDSRLVATEMSNALKKIDDTNVADAIAQLSDAWARRETLRERLNEQGLGGVVQ